MQGPKRNQNCVFNEAYRVIEYIFVPRWFIFGIEKAESTSNNGYELYRLNGNFIKDNILEQKDEKF